nr:MAG TPA: hypothetical protein [Caudoviricetes sp.]
MGIVGLPGFVGCFRMWCEPLTRSITHPSACSIFNNSFGFIISPPYSYYYNTY